MNEAIKLAIEKGGYKVEEITTPLKKCEQDPVIKERVNIEGSNGYWDWFVYNDFIVDPLFWQALGKALGWKEYTDVTVGNWDEMKTISPMFKLTWKYQAHEYLEQVLTGGSTEKFWKDLLQ